MSDKPVIENDEPIRRGRRTREYYSLRSPNGLPCKEFKLGNDPDLPGRCVCGWKEEDHGAKN